jgi:protease YdgD
LNTARRLYGLLLVPAGVRIEKPEFLAGVRTPILLGSAGDPRHLVRSDRPVCHSSARQPDGMRTRPGPASVITAAVLLLGSGAVAGLLPGVGLVDRRMVVDARQPPWNAVAKVQTNAGTHCTGALVGRQIVITSAHCLYNPRTHGLVRPVSLHILFGYERGGFLWHTLVTGYVVGGGFDGTRPGQQLAADWARLDLAQAPPPGIEPLKLAQALPPPGTPVALAGYSQDRTHLLMADRSCRITGILTLKGGQLLTHDCSSTRGTSGGPLLIERGDRWEVVGVNIAVTLSANIALPAAALSVGG